MVEKFILMDMNDERSKKISEVLGNKTCKKIIDYLSEVKEASEKDISDKLGVPINTIEYNLKKLIESGLVEKTKNFFWSVKGKKIDMYRLSNKKILISPRTFVKGIIPAFIGVILTAFGIKVLSDKLNYSSVNQATDVSRAVGSGASQASNAVVSSAPSIAEKVSGVAGSYTPTPVDQLQSVCSNINSVINTEVWAWFLLGGLVAILIILLWNQFNKTMKGGF